MNNETDITEEWLLELGFTGEDNCYPLTIGVEIQLCVNGPHMKGWYIMIPHEDVDQMWLMNVGILCQEDVLNFLMCLRLDIPRPLG